MPHTYSASYAKSKIYPQTATSASVLPSQGPSAFLSLLHQQCQHYSHGPSRPQLPNLPSRLPRQPSHNPSLSAANHAYSSPPTHPRIATAHHPSQAVKRKTTSRFKPACHSCFYGIRYITAQFHCSTLQCMGSFLATPKRHAQNAHSLPAKTQSSMFHIPPLALSQNCELMTLFSPFGLKSLCA